MLKDLSNNVATESEVSYDRFYNTNEQFKQLYIYIQFIIKKNT